MSSMEGYTVQRIFPMLALRKYTALIFLISLPVVANERNHLSGSVSRFYTTDDFVISNQSLRLMNNRRNLFWNYKDAESEAYDIGAQIDTYQGRLIDEDYRSTSAEVIVGRKIDDKNYVSLSFGGHTLENEDDDFSVAIFSLQYLRLFNNSRASLSYSKDYQFIDQMIPDSITDGLYRDISQVNWEYSGFTDIRVPIQVRHYSVSDENSGRDVDVSILYGRSYPTWWWIGLGYYDLSYQKGTTGYWSPEAFYAVGPRFELAQPLGNLWQIRAGYNYSLIKENSADQGSSTFSSLAIDYGDRNEWLVSLEWNDIRSEQGGFEWNSAGYIFSFEKSF